jgi:hypothetical protein
LEFLQREFFSTRKNVTEGRSKGPLEAQVRVHTWPSFLAAWWGALSPLGVALPPPFYGIFISWKNLRLIFHVFSEMEAKVPFFYERGPILH